MHLSEQEIVRREALEQIKELGIEPFPAAGFDVNFKTTDFTTKAFEANLIKSLESLKGVGREGAKKIADFLRKNKFKSSALLENEEIVKAYGFSETVEFDESIERQPMPLEDFIATLRTECLGDFQAEKMPEVRIAGRYMRRRGSFAELQDANGNIQIFVGKGKFGETDESKELNAKLLKLIHLGDFIGVTGELFVTQMGELTVRVQELKFLSKALRNLPVVKVGKDGQAHDAFTDPELRYRQRYVDLVVNPEVKKTFVKRTKMYRSMREFLDAKGYLEVETPIL